MATRKLQFKMFDDQVSRFEAFKRKAAITNDSEAIRVLLDVALAERGISNDALRKAGYREGSMAALAEFRKRLGVALSDMLEEINGA